VETFSIGYDEDYGSYRNELHYARLMAASVGAHAHEQRLSMDDLIGFLPRMIELQDEPIADPVCVPVFYVAKLARERGVIVCQVGEGADELFWGYPAWRRALQLQRWDGLPVPRFLKRLGLTALRGLGKQRTRHYEWLRRGVQGQPIFWGGAEAFTDAEKHRLLSPRLRRQFAGRTSWEALEPIHRRFREKAWEPSPLHWMSYLDLNLRLPELLLMRVDKMAMGVSLEARVPFLDHKFVELALSIPQAAKTRGGVLKHLLKRAVRGLIPNELIDRPKQGFGVPVHEWFMGRLGQTARQELEQFCHETDFLDAGEVSRLFQQDRGAQLWYLFNFALWWRHYIDSAVALHGVA
jgi:asparagine synthase (glutamine-hydrolysing)